MKQWSVQHRWLLLLVGCVAALFVLAACGGEEEGAEPTATGAAAAESPTPMVEAPCEGGPGVTGEGDALKIGLLVPSTGPLSTFGPDYINAANLAAKCLNNEGGVNGGAVEIVTADTATNAEVGVTEAERLVNVEGVVAILGAAASSVTLAVAESVTVPNEILQISPASTSVAITVVEDNDFLFRMPISDKAQGNVLASLVRNDLGLTKVCDLYVDNAYGQGLSQAFAENFEALGGTVTASVPHDDLEAVSYLAQLNQCVEGEPEALVAISYPTGQAMVYLREALENDLIDTFVFVDGTKEDDIFDLLGWDIFDGMLGTAPGAVTFQSGLDFDAAFTAEYGEIYQTPFVREGFDAIIAMALAAQAAGTNTDSAAIRDSLRDVGNAPGTEYSQAPADLAAALSDAAAGVDIDYQGASGSVGWDENGDVVFGGIEVWRVDAATETLITDRIFAVDLIAGTVEEAE